MLDTRRRSLMRRTQVRVVQIADREVSTIGLHNGFWTDLHHRAVTVNWPKFFIAAAVIFAGFNCLFAGLYALGDKPIANVEPGSWLGLLYFSIETLATVGYGDMHPQTHYGHFIATIEIFTGMSLLAVMTGLVFTRFSQPKARFLFARSAVVSQYDGAPTLMIRLANARHNAISGATAKLWLVRNEQTREGLQIRRFHELKLQRQENPIFALSWTLFHTIDATSPLAGVPPEDFAIAVPLLAVSVTGLDESTSQQLHARQNYGHQDVIWGHRYADILIGDPKDTRVQLDYRRFHDVVPEPSRAEPPVTPPPPPGTCGPHSPPA